MIHWEEAEDERGRKVWHRYVECSHWGLVLTKVLPRWIIPYSWERGIAQVRALT